MHLMHHWDSVPDSAVAPSPVVPTCRRDHTYKPLKPPKRSKPSMASSVSGSPESTVSRGSVARHQARSAGMAERPTRNESLSDLVRFFQTQNVPTGAPMSSPDQTTALPTVESPEAKEVSKEQLKPLHRRLLQFTQRQKKDSPKSKSSEHQRQIEALQREGYLLPAPKPKETGHRSSGSVDRSSNSLDQVLSKSKRQDVETIGQPWLQSKSSDTSRSSYSKRRLASLDLDDFGSMVDVAVSLSEYDDPSPPPYQPSGSTAAMSRGDSTTASQSTPAPQSDISSSEGPSNRTSDWLISPSTSTSFAETQRSGSFEEHGPRPTSSNSSIRIIDEDIKPVPKPSRTPAQVPTSGSSSKSETRETTQEQTSTVDQSSQPQEPQHPPPHPPSNPSPPSLKLFPDVAPPRNSSKKAFRLSSAPRYQTPAKPASSASSDACSDTETPKQLPQKQPQATRPPSASSSVQKDELDSYASLDKAASGEARPESKALKAASAPKPSKVRPPSLAMNTLQAFPLPAPTRPLPSVPKSSSLSVPADPKTQTPVRSVRSGPTALNIQASQPSPIPEEPRELELRPATVLGHVTTGDEASVDDSEPAQSVQVTPERPKSTSPEQSTPRRRAASFHASSLRDLPESPPSRYDCSSEGFPLADSPILGQLTPTKPFGKRAVRTGLEINSRIGRKDLPFGLPSPPPSAALPADPPIQNTARSGHRNYTAPTGAGPSKTLDLAFNPASHRSSLISRSNSSRSSLRHESIPESSEPSRSGSPLPSSDEECFGPRAGPKRSHRVPEKSQQRQRPKRRGYETFDGRASSQRARLVQPMRSLTPQGRSSYGTEQSASPMSHYSQSTFRSCESLNSIRPQAPANDVAQLFEDRIANLERQNQILQAALMAALNAGVKPNMPNINLHESAVPPSFHAAPPNHPYPSRSASRPDSWMSSSHGSEQGGYDALNSSRYSRANAH